MLVYFSASSPATDVFQTGKTRKFFLQDSRPPVSCIVELWPPYSVRTTYKPYHCVGHSDNLWEHYMAFLVRTSYNEFLASSTCGVCLDLVGKILATKIAKFDLESSLRTLIRTPNLGGHSRSLSWETLPVSSTAKQSGPDCPAKQSCSTSLISPL